MSMEAEPAGNLRKAESLARSAARDGAQVICLPELFRTPYFCQREDPGRFELSEPVDGPSTQTMAALARSAGVVLIVPIFERRAPGLYHNSAVVLDADGSIAGLYRKMHLPDDPSFYEKYYFTPGDLGFRAPDTRFGRIGVLICWDQWFPEAARLTAMAGAEVIFCPTAIGWHPRDRSTAEGSAQWEAWRAVQRGHAIANGVTVAAVNRTGFESSGGAGEGLYFWGRSFACDPFGVSVAEADEGESVLHFTVSRRRTEEVRRQWPFWRDRRTDAFSGLEKRWGDGGGIP
jgi:N-carbamoylputrescine amidase